MVDSSILWISLPLPFRLAILAFVISSMLLFLTYQFRNVLSKVIRYTEFWAIKILKIIIFLLLGITQFLLILLYRVFKNNLQFLYHSFENLAYYATRLFFPLENFLEPFQFTLKKKYILRGSGVFSLLVLLLMYIIPDSKIAAQLGTYDQSINIYMNVSETSTLEAQNQLAAFFDDLSSSGEDGIDGVSSWLSDIWEAGNADAESDSASDQTDQLYQLQLKQDYDGGNIREQPIDGAVIAVLDPEEFVYYLNNEVTAENGIVWIEVETQQGQTGWISSSIVELIE